MSITIRRFIFADQDKNITAWWCGRAHSDPSNKKLTSIVNARTSSPLKYRIAFCGCEKMVYVMRLISLVVEVTLKKKNIVAGKFFFWVRALSLPISKKPSLCHIIHSLTLRSTVLKEQKGMILSLGNRWNVTIRESRDLTDHLTSCPHNILGRRVRTL